MEWCFRKFNCWKRKRNNEWSYLKTMLIAEVIGIQEMQNEKTWHCMYTTPLTILYTKTSQYPLVAGWFPGMLKKSRRSRCLSDSRCPKSLASKRGAGLWPSENEMSASNIDGGVHQIILYLFNR
jgi:hypothetical protein